MFLDLFQDKKNLLKLYKALHPEDTDATEDTLDIITIDNILTDNLYIDLGIMVGNNKLLLLLEAQSSWTVNILIRILLYYISSTQAIGGRKPNTISLSKKFFDGADIDIEVKVKVIYESETKDIINQYIIFCKVFDEQRKLYGMTEQTVRETIRICKDRNVLKEYLMNREMEVVTIMMSLFNDEQIMKTYWKDMENTLTDKITHDKDREIAERLIKKGKMSLEDIADCVPALSFDELKEIENEVMQLA